MDNRTILKLKCPFIKVHFVLFTIKRQYQGNNLGHRNEDCCDFAVSLLTSAQFFFQFMETPQALLGSATTAKLSTATVPSSTMTAASTSPRNPGWLEMEQIVSLNNSSQAKLCDSYFKGYFTNRCKTSETYRQGSRPQILRLQTCIWQILFKN